MLIRPRRLALFAVGIVVATAVPADRLEQYIGAHKDWIEDCTDLPVSVAKRVKGDLFLYSVMAEHDSGELFHCLLSKGRRVMEDSLSLGDHVDFAAMVLPPFQNSYTLKTGSPITVAEALIRSEERVLVVSADGNDGIERIGPVSENSFLVQVGYATHSRVYHVTDRAEAYYLTNGDVDEVTRSEDGSCRIHMKSTKSYFWKEGGGAFWFDATIDCEGNLLDIVTQMSELSVCMSVEVLSERSGLDLSRLKRQEVCIER